MKTSELQLSSDMNPKISVIVPIYNTANFLNHCVESIIKQTYENLEIILVNDCSTDNSADHIARLEASDTRIRVISHEQNRGLFQARLTGYEHATGKYIAFVDSDDYLSIDWFRVLLRKAEATGSDMVVGEWCYDFDDGHQAYLNLDHFRLKDYYLADQQVMDAFMDVQGQNFSWTVVWNKLYKKKLWDRCYKGFKQFSDSHGHMLMWEDIAFSSALWTYAKCVTNVHDIMYFYRKHMAAATSLSNDHRKNLKYINDASAAISFMKQTLDESNLLPHYSSQFRAWNTWALNQVYSDLVIRMNTRKYRSEILQAFHAENYTYAAPDDFFHSITSSPDGFKHLEASKKIITSENIRYVSFDIFDTLIQRPFMYPTDLFQLLSEEFNQGLASYVNFRNIRETAEAAVRAEQNLIHPSTEDVTLDQIYDYITAHYAFSPEKIAAIKLRECELELQYCRLRKAGKELFDLALEYGKTIIICSDMYLPKTLITEILQKNGITGYTKLYLSSDIGLTKARKSLYHYIQKDLNEKDSHLFLHIGDNIHSDTANAQACGWNSIQLPKATDILMNEVPDTYGGEAYHRLFRNSFFKEDYPLAFNDFTSIRSMTALAANKIFDSPYVSTNPYSDFNADPRIIGYAALGPHLLAICQWIQHIVNTRKIGTIHFVARDGYLVKQAYDRCVFTGKANTNYIRLSRKALMLCDVNTPEDLYSLFNKVTPFLTPAQLAEYLAPIIPTHKADCLSEILSVNGFSPDKTLQGNVEWAACMKLFIEQLVDLSLLSGYKDKLRTYFACFVKPGDFIFDIGYSGRPESALSNILHFPVGSMYIHINSEIASIRQEKYGCPCEVFYNYKPAVTGTLREHLLMELAPSTIGYKEVNGELEPIFEPYESGHNNRFITTLIQEHALDFIDDYCQSFGKYNCMWNFQSETASAVYEYYLHCAKEIDQRITKAIQFEDELNGKNDIRLYDFWRNELSWRNIGHYNTSSDAEIPGDIIPGISADGYLMDFARRINKMFPRGGRKRRLVKALMKTFHLSK